MLRRSWVPLLFLAASIAPSLAADEYSNIHKLAIVSTLDSAVNGQHIGMTIFTHTEFTLDLGWNPNDQLVQQIKAALTPRFDFVDAPPDIFMNVHADDDYRHAILAAPVTNGADAYVVVVTDSQAAGYTYTGLSLTTSGNLYHGADTSLGARYKILVFDAVTGKQIDYATGQVPDRGNLLGHAPPGEICAGEMGADAAEAFATEQKTRVRKEFSALLSRSVAYTLAGAELIDKETAIKMTATFDTEGDASCHPLFR